jgi:hypothetical protein
MNSGGDKAAIKQNNENSTQHKTTQNETQHGKTQRSGWNYIVVIVCVDGIKEARAQRR